MPQQKLTIVLVTLHAENENTSAPKPSVGTSQTIMWKNYQYEA